MISRAPFNKEAIHDAQITPLISEIIAICKEHGIPMLASFNYRHGGEPDDPNGDAFCTTSLDDGAGWFPSEFCEAFDIIRRGSSERPKVMAFTITSTTTDKPKTPP